MIGVIHRNDPGLRAVQLVRRIQKVIEPPAQGNTELQRPFPGVRGTVKFGYGTGQVELLAKPGHGVLHLSPH